MGGGSYSMYSRSTRSTTLNYASATADTLGDVMPQAKKKQIHKSLSPKGVTVRESRDSADHPESYAIIIGIDFTGSMGDVPAMLVRDGLPNLIQKTFESGIADPQIAFIGIGDHECDRVPLQVGQFESSDEKLDADLTNMYPEKGGGGNGGESYLLAWYHAARHTDIDCLNKRGQKGVLITIGDEPCLGRVSGDVLAELYGLQSESSFTDSQLLAEASGMYHVYHINVRETYTGRHASVSKYWRELLGDNFIEVQHHNEIPGIIAEIISSNYIGARREVEVELSDGTKATVGVNSVPDILL